MKIILNTYKHAESGFLVTVTTCNKRVVTTKKDSGETVKFNRSKFEWMIQKGIFLLQDSQVHDY